jgi:hypothetical protein
MREVTPKTSRKGYSLFGAKHSENIRSNIYLQNYLIFNTSNIGCFFKMTILLVKVSTFAACVVVLLSSSSPGKEIRRVFLPEIAF